MFDPMFINLGLGSIAMGYGFVRPLTASGLGASVFGSFCWGACFVHFLF